MLQVRMLHSSALHLDSAGCNLQEQVLHVGLLDSRVDDLDSGCRLATRRPHRLNLLHHIHPLLYLAEYHVLAVEEGRWNRANEELAGCSNVVLSNGDVKAGELARRRAKDSRSRPVPVWTI